MADTDILRAYLIKIGFKVDEAQQKKVNATTAEIGKTISAMGKVAAGAAVAFVAGVAKMANELDGLYWASKRTGTSVGNIKAMGFAASQLGSTAEASASSLANFSRLLKTNPGSEGIFKELGIQARDANGKLRDTVDLMTDLGKKLGGMDYAQANQYAQLFGIDEKMLDAMRDPKFGQLMDEQRARVKAMGADMDESAKVAHEYAQAMGEIKDTVTVLATAVGSKLLPTLRDASAAMQEMTRDWVKILKNRTMEDVGNDVVTGLMLQSPGLKSFAQKRLGGGVVMSERTRKSSEAGELRQFDNDFKPYGSGGSIPSTRVGTEKGRGGSGGAASTRVGTEKGRGGSGAGSAAPMDARMRFAVAASASLGVPIDAILAQTALETGRDGSKTVGAYNFGNIKAGSKWKGETASLNALEYDKSGKAYNEASKFRAYSSPEDAGQDYAELLRSRFKDAASAKTIKDFAQGLKSGGYATDPDYVNKLVSVANSMQNPYGRDAARPAPQINQTTTITVNGAGDARDTASAVSSAQNGVNQSLVRNLTPRVM